MKYPEFDLSLLVPGTIESIPVPEDDFWIFAYGSLMWNPGFDYIDAQPGIVYGYHRRLCLWSVRYRGTVQRPGLVLGLDRGGSCRGFAYRIAEHDAERVTAYLCDRELITGAYDAKLCSVELDSKTKVSALTFVSKPDHPHFAPKLALSDTIEVVSKASGARGANREYVLNTVSHLSQMDIHNTELHKVASHLDRKS